MKTDQSNPKGAFVWKSFLEMLTGGELSSKKMPGNKTFAFLLTILGYDKFLDLDL